MKKNNLHTPVLVQQVIEYLITDRAGIYVDGTLGAGGHSIEILKRLNENGKLIGIDCDEEILAKTKIRLQPFENRCFLKHGNFAQIKEILTLMGIAQVDGILVDLGVSSFQIDTPERGFSYLKSGPLDMRMSNSLTTTAADIINSVTQDRLAWIFRNYGEEKRANSIAQAIVKQRHKEEIKTTHQLTEIVSNLVHYQQKIKTLARIYQALRIEVNNELDNLENFLSQTTELLRSGGRLVIISYHSLEDRLVKEFFVHQANPCHCPAELPFCICNKKPILRILTKKVIKPTLEENEINPRSRSSRLRACEKI